MFLGSWGVGRAVCVCEDPGGGLTDDLVLVHSLGRHRGFWTVEAQGAGVSMRGLWNGVIRRLGAKSPPFNQLSVWTLA